MSRVFFCLFSVFLLQGCALFRTQEPRQHKIILKHFYQNKKPWASVKYVCRHPKTDEDRQGTILRGGSLPTALASVLASYGKKVNPKTVADFFVTQGYRTCNKGTKMTALLGGRVRFGYEVGLTGYYGAYRAVMSNKLVIALVVGQKSIYTKYGTRSYFTDYAQYIVLSGYKKNKFRVHNTWKYDKDAKKEGWLSARFIVSDAIRFFVIYPM